MNTVAIIFAVIAGVIVLLLSLALKVRKWKAIGEKDRAWLDKHYRILGPIALTVAVVALPILIDVDSTILWILWSLWLLGGLMWTFFRGPAISFLIGDLVASEVPREESVARITTEGSGGKAASEIKD